MSQITDDNTSGHIIGLNGVSCLYRNYSFSFLNFGVGWSFSTEKSEKTVMMFWNLTFHWNFTASLGFRANLILIAWWYFHEPIK